MNFEYPLNLVIGECMVLDFSISYSLRLALTPGRVILIRISLIRVNINWYFF